MTGIGLGTGFVLLVTVLLGGWVAKGLRSAGLRPRPAALRLTRRGTLSALGLAATAVLGFACDDLLMAGNAGSSTSTWVALSPVAAAIPGITALALTAVLGFGRVLECDERKLEQANPAPSVAALAELQTVLERELLARDRPQLTTPVAATAPGFELDEVLCRLEDGHPV